MSSSSASSSSPSSTRSNSPKPRKNPYDIHQASFENVYIGISGLIGAGKSTLAAALGKKLHLPVYYEPVKDNIYLADFYKDLAKYAFAMQVYLLNQRFKQQQVIIWQGKGGVQDRTIYEDSVFAKMLVDSGLMEKRDYQTYLELFQHMSNFMKKPNIIVHLDVSPEESLRRIKTRSRGCETGISLEYLKNLHQAYEVFLKDISRIIPVIKVNYEKFRTVDEMADAIAEQYNAMCMIREVNWDNGQQADETGVFEAKLSEKATKEVDKDERKEVNKTPELLSSSASVSPTSSPSQSPSSASSPPVSNSLSPIKLMTPLSP
eukprot:TRINITY_DN4129_c0_g1_i1.p1 TRINITY_DN4129_c0_g1~~TRINITY_DN4129_c0_g1_i1.p1  ORF type:complete len:319 (+),score=98.62 TRINITY_DN4129_c0_g1_i1:49-1005(+)